MLCNCRSLLPKIDELCMFNILNKHDIILLTETWLHDNIKDELINMPNYKLFRNDRLHKRGGGAVSYTHLTLPTIYSV